MRKKYAVLALIIVAVAWAAAACVPRVQQPEVRLASVRVGGLGLQGGLLYVRVNIMNPNRFALQTREVTYDIEITDPTAAEGQWSRLAEGTYLEPIQIGSRDSAVVEIPIEFRYSGVGGALRSILDTGTFRYQVSGRVGVTEPLRTEVPYRHRGTVSLF